ncbi:hypothetical protein F511_41381 [Dorcoceras hygrometricum]|uniref:Uncharacterized protein n=1 Tax=Dorcoceras hygrometricum TaxID=472368 RepID=A0A2Z7BFX7_9LAMI|nr:hypothetical protein F511_41381 [Dorcoceras hygrometricum]
MDEQIAAIRNEHLDFQSKIAADILSLSTQVGDIADFLRSGAAKKGEMGSSSLPTAFDVENPIVLISSGLLVQSDEGVSDLVVDRIDESTAINREAPAQNRRLPLSTHAAAAAYLRRKFVSGQFDEENPFVLISSVLLVQPDEGVSVLVVDRIGDNLPQSTEKSRVLVIPVGARHKCQQACLSYGRVDEIRVDRKEDN